MQFVKCPRCKRVIFDRVRRCPGCGTPIHEGAGADGARRRSDVWRRIGVGAVFVALVIFGVYVFGWAPEWRRKPPPRPSVPVRALPTPDTKFGLSEAARRDIYKDILRARDRAQLEADRRYPPPDPGASADRWRLYSETREQFLAQADEEDKSAIAEHHHLTPGQLVEIGEEGTRRNWPRPRLRSLR